MAKTVIDVSYAQGRIDWKRVYNRYKLGKIHGVIIRVGYGADIASQDDKWYSVNIAAAEKYRIPYGLYLYSYAKTDEASKSENAHMIRLARNRQPIIGVFIDLEENALGYHAESAAKSFCSALGKLGYKTGIYCGAYYYKQYMPKLHDTIKDLWWIAGYGTNSGIPEMKYKPDTGFTYNAWQYTSMYQIDGIENTVDASLWYTDWKTTGQQVTPVVNDFGIKYRAHCQTYGWLPSVRDGQVAGTEGEGKRLEAFKITPPDGVELDVDAHLQSKGWVSYKGIKKGKSSGTESSVNDPIIGTVGESRRIEAIIIRCAKNRLKKTLRYQVHVQGIGWQEVKKEGEVAGTTGQSRRIEAIRIWFD